MEKTDAIVGGMKKKVKSPIKPTGKIKAKVLDDVEDAETFAEKKKISEDDDDDDDDDPNNIADPDDDGDGDGDDKPVGSDYEGESDDYDELSSEIDKKTHDETPENLYDTNYYREIRVVPDNMRITSDIMTLFEFSEVVGIRTSQIEKGSHVFTDVTLLHTPHEMAIKELFDRKSPLKIIRRISVLEQEEWKCNDMGFPFDIRSSF
jgi:DNA-directed RNA polymerase I, II, and III subunit RPABC2